MRLVPLPWKRVLRQLEEGQIDGFFGYAPWSWAVLSIFVRKGEVFPFQKIEDLYGKRIGIVRGFTTSPEFDRAMREGLISVDESGSYGSLIKMLDAKRIDGIAGVASTLQAHFDDMHLTGRFVMLPHPITGPKPIYICVSKRHNVFTAPCQLGDPTR